MEKWVSLRQNKNYLISNYGRIKRPSNRNADFIMSTKHSSGYPVLLNIKMIDGSRKSFRVNKLVYEHFVDWETDWNILDVVNVDGDNYNCHIDNLKVHLKRSHIDRCYRVYKIWIKRKIKNEELSRCSICCHYKPTTDFYYHKTLDKPMSFCKPCQNKRYYSNLKNKTAKDPILRLIYNYRIRTSSAFRYRGYKKDTKTARVLGCSWSELKEHIQSQFTDGMTWDNYGDWEVDHRLPLSKAKTKEQVKLLSHYTNLQPLWKSENRSKGDSISKEDEFEALWYGIDV